LPAPAKETWSKRYYFQKGTEISRQDRKFMKETAKGDIPFAEKEKVCRSYMSLEKLAWCSLTLKTFKKNYTMSAQSAFCPLSISFYYERCAFHNT